MSKREDFRRSLLVWARATLGTTEKAHNSGPEIDEWLKYAHSAPGNPWCGAWTVFGHRAAAAACDLANPCPITAGVHRLWELTPIECKVRVPYPGCVYFLEHSPTTGHCGIVEVVSPGGTVVTEISGNTNRAGSREGNQVAEHHGPPDLTHHGVLLGYADYSELIPLEVGIDGLPQSPFA